MKFCAMPLERAAGAVLGHNVHDGDGRRVLRKGRALGEDELALLASLGRTRIWAARLEAGDVDEDQAALRVSRAVAGAGVALRGPTTGRVNLHAEALGLVRVDAEALGRINECDGVTLATLANHAVAREGKMVGTTKILPYAVPERSIEAAERAAEQPVVRLDPLLPRTAGIIVSGTVAGDGSGTAAQGSQAADRSAPRPGRERLVRGFEAALAGRLEPLNASLSEVRFVAIEGEQDTKGLAAAARHLASKVDLLILAGETAIQDRHDLAPSAIEAAGGTVICYGAPVDPGNLLLLAELAGTPVVGAPGCARSPKRNIVDLVLPRLLAGDRLSRRDITALGHGGLLDDVPERPLPRRRIERP